LSVRIMSAAWAVDLPAGEKLVLLALADCANDEGHCWPGLTNLARKTGKSRRSLIDTIHALEKAEHISRDVRVGKGVNYTIHPRASEQLALPIAGATAAPVQKSHQCKKAYPTGAKSAPKPSGTVIGIEAKASIPKAWALPAGVSLQVWTDFLTNRKRKRLPNTDTAWKSFNDDLAKVSAQTGIPPPELIRQCTAKGWGGIYDPRERNDGQQRTNTMGRHQSSDGLSKTTRAARDVFGTSSTGFNRAVSQ
jgi:hypothetical protein